MRAVTASVIARDEAIERAHMMDQELEAELQPGIAQADHQGRMASQTADAAMVSAEQLRQVQVIADMVHNDLQAQITALTQLLIQGLDANAQNDAETEQRIRAAFAAADAQVRADFHAFLAAVYEHFDAQLAVVHSQLEELEGPQYVVGTVTSLPAGSAPTVTITGTEAPYALNFGIPQGAMGLTGLQGTAGTPGATGPAGPAGASGITRLALGVGRIALALVLGQSVDVVVQLSRPMATTGYTVTVPPQSGWTFGTPKNKTTTSVTIPVTAALALAVGATFILEAYE